MMNKLNGIFSYLDELFPEPKCELNYKKDYELLIAVMLSAQTTDKKVNAVTSKLFKKYNSLEKISNAELDDIKHIIKPIGTFNKKALFIKKIAKKLIEDYNSQVPNDRNALESLDGVGRKTTNVVMSMLFDYPAIAVDTHVSRISKRLGLVNHLDSVDIIENKLMKQIDKDRWSRTHYQFVLFGRYYCKSIKPICDNCKLKNICNKRI